MPKARVNRRAAPWRATLRRGRVYVLGNKTFTRGQPQWINDKDKQHLEQNAVDSVTITDGESKYSEERPKFEFVHRDELEDGESADADSEGKGE